MGKNANDKAKERREQRRQEISLLRTIPYSDHQRWWSAKTIAVVTGGNRGIGFDISRQLAAHGLTVILTSRDSNVGLEAAKVLQEGGLNVAFHQLDVLDPLSIKNFADWLHQNYGGLDILVNNAGVNFNIGSENSVEQARMVVATNYFGTKKMIEAMIPLMKPSAVGARIVNVSSRLGRLNGRRNKMKKGKACGPDDIPIEVWIALGDAGIVWLTKLLNEILKKKHMPDAWRKNILVPIFKNKGDVLNCNN
ncbi:(+)-neomenthol dehydrogenase [Morus notabilis]|uniref:(+)-neomenthol dehydrogenase n=1 Tax=Morus notabilis TaxID=981085 RepID=W9RKS0_9ROSA|nr:(+)-neomenthol dehydrogenase [Morus notabilis]